MIFDIMSLPFLLFAPDLGLVGAKYDYVVLRLSVKSSDTAELRHDDGRKRPIDAEVPGFLTPARNRPAAGYAAGGNTAFASNTGPSTRAR